MQNLYHVIVHIDFDKLQVFDFVVFGFLCGFLFFLQEVLRGWTVQHLLQGSRGQETGGGSQGPSQRLLLLMSVRQAQGKGQKSEQI